MRAVFALIVVVVGLAAAGAVSLPPISTHARASEIAHKPQAPAPSAIASGIKALNGSYRAHREGFTSVSKYSENVRRNRLLALAGIVVFLVLTLPRNARGVRNFYRQLVGGTPLPDFPNASADNVRRARAVLFFYLLFLLYQIVEFPLTLGRDNIVQFSADLSFQSALLVALIGTYQSLKKHLRAEWRDDPERREKMDLFLNEKLEGMSIRWRDIQKLALGVFAVGFAPVTLAHLPDWLDVLSALGDRIAGA